MKESSFSVVFVDEDILVLDKQSGLLVAADRYDAEAPRLDNLAEKQFGRVWAVHRIDKDTSGLVIYARTEAAHRALSVQFQDRAVTKLYQALVRGHLAKTEVTVDLPLVVDADARHRTCAKGSIGKPSLTFFHQAAVLGSYSWLEARIATGRTHQIRAHLGALGLAVVADPLYGDGKPLFLSEVKRSYRGDRFEERPLLARLGLHAGMLGLRHPATGEALVFTSPLHKDMAAAKKQLEKLYGKQTNGPLASKTDASSHEGADQSGSPEA